MKICPNCGHENNDTGKFCEECGTKLVEAPKFCPECGTKLEGTPKFCPECGFNLTTGANNEDATDDYEEDSYESDGESEDTYSYEDENDNSYSDESDDYEEYVDEDEYKDEETFEEKIRKIVDKYIKKINKSNTVYVYKWLHDPEYSQVLQNVRSYIVKDVKESEILGYIDTSLFGKGKAGLVFTTYALFLKEGGGSFELPYNIISSLNIKKGSLYFPYTKGYGKGLLNLDEVYIDGISFNLPALKDCIEEIKNIWHEASEKQNSQLDKLIQRLE